MRQIERLPLLMSLQHFTKRHFINATVANSVYLPAESDNKAINKRFVERFESALALRGESVTGALNALRASGFKMSRSTLHRWKNGQMPYFNSFQFIVLAHYVNKSFAEMVAE